MITKKSNIFKIYVSMELPHNMPTAWKSRFFDLSVFKSVGSGRNCHAVGYYCLQPACAAVRSRYGLIAFL